MAGERFYLKEKDTRPILSVTLLDPGSTTAVPIVHDCTGATGVYLHIRLANGDELIRDMVFDVDRTSGIVTYTWLATDWTGDPALITGPAVPLSSVAIDHKMEYEVLGPAAARMTFPNNGYDLLTIYPEIGQGT